MAKGGGPMVFAAICAIEQALWDIKGKALSVPVYEMLGGKMRDSVRVYANGWCGNARTPGGLAKAAERPLGDGSGALKCYPSRMALGCGTYRGAWSIAIAPIRRSRRSRRCAMPSDLG